MLIRIVSLILILSNTAFADCKDELKLCDIAVTKQQVLITELNTQIVNYQKLSEIDKMIISTQQDKLNSPFRDPIKVALTTTLVVIILGIVTGHVK